MSTYQRVRDVLADGEWHSIEELRKVSRFPERWLEELRKDGLEVMVDSYEGNVALVGGPRDHHATTGPTRSAGSPSRWFWGVLMR